MFTLTENAAYKLVGEYMVVNNQWGRDGAGIEPYRQIMIGSESLPLFVTWEWDWPPGTRTMKAYPGIVYGDNPWVWTTPRSSTVRLPAKISGLGDIPISFDVQTVATGHYNTAFEFWTITSLLPTVESIECEIMVWINRTAGLGPQEGEYTGRVTIDGDEYNYLLKPYNPPGKIYVAFIRVNPVLIGRINVKHFLDYLVETSIISSNSYLASVEFGNEILYGVGQTTINQYSIGE